MKLGIHFIRWSTYRNNFTLDSKILLEAPNGKAFSYYLNEKRNVGSFMVVVS